MIKVELLSHSSADPIELISHAALACYQSAPPEMGKKIDVENRLFKTGHHTTLQHIFFTFNIEGISVGDIIFGMHMVNPFYNSDERSGRYCAKMFLEPDFNEIRTYISNYWPEVNKSTVDEIMDYVKKSSDVYYNNIEKAIEYTKELIKIERPNSSDKYVELNGPKIAQEQMRTFIPVIFPTGFDFSVNLTVLAAMHKSAWTAPMRDATDRMVKLVVEKFPEVAFVFNYDNKVNSDWSPEFLDNNEVKFSPELEVLSIEGVDNFIIPKSEALHPIDLLHFLPEMMDNSIYDIKTKIEVSIATMHQDQRHRTIRRSQPFFTGNIYLPSVPEKCGLTDAAKQTLANWKYFKNKIPATLLMVLAPYGAMVTYSKKGSFNAIAHEQGKRLCFCAQEEIYNLGRIMRKEIEDKYSKSTSLLNIFEPPCYKSGICAEGARYCGRDLRERNSGNFFPKRKI